MTAQQLAIMATAEMDSQPQASADFVTMTVGDQMFGIPVLEVRDVLGPQNIAHVPLAPPEVSGALNLRGRIVTAIDMRIRLGLPARSTENKGMSIVVDYSGELYSLIVDKVGEVMNLPAADFEKNPPTLSSQWREFSNGIYRMQGRLLIILEVMRLLRLAQEV